MSSIIPGYEYDIFISYRQKDNKYDGWVTEFVNNLRKELEATFKEEISIYFDKNPFDGILETYDVDKSLKGKLKCLIFIPVISQTYCDPKSFAWQNEFCAFNKMAKADQFGRDIKLNNGNIASRILPVKIHDLDIEDRTIFESESGGALRTVEFIYRESGVNRSLSPKDNREDNLYKTQYRNQINKVANEIKEIIPNLKTFDRSMLLTARQIGTLLAVNTEISTNSIAVLPFVNMSSDPEQEFFSDGLTDEIITNLSRIEGLFVISRSSMMTFKGKDKKINEIANEVKVRYVMEGSVRRSGNNLRITAQLIDALNDTHVWVEKYNGKSDDIFDIQEKVSRAIAKVMKLKLSGKDEAQLAYRPIQNTKVFEWYIRARQEMLMRTKKGLDNAIEFAHRGLGLVEDNALLYATLGSAYLYIQHFGLRADPSNLKMAEQYATKSLAIDPDCSQAQLILGLLKFKNGNLQEASHVFNKLHHLDSNNPDIMIWQIVTYFIAGRPEAARPVLEKLMKVDPLNILSNSLSGLIEFYSGNLKESLPYYQQWLQMDGENPFTKFNCIWNFALNGYLVQSIHLLDNLINDTPTLIYGKFALFLKSALQGHKKNALKYATDELKQEAASIDFFPINMAWGYALINEKEEAVTWLNKSLDFGYSPYPLMLKFEIFHRILNDNPGFQMFMAEVKSRSEEFEV